MVDRTVLQFPRREQVPSKPASLQRDLFDQIDGSRAKVVFLAISELSEDLLFQIIAQNLVTALVDLRFRPIFRAPKFRHKNIMSHLFAKNIKYVEASLIAGAVPDQNIDIGAHIIPLISKELDVGMVIFVYDREEKEKNWLLSVRSHLRKDPRSLAELHPNVLVRVR